MLQAIGGDLLVERENAYSVTSGTALTDVITVQALGVNLNYFLSLVGAQMLQLDHVPPPLFYNCDMLLISMEAQVFL